ncbi:MAG: amino acid ABC transporter substrate-binding protein [Oscillospiraceae bacterium]|nr:amino acid ABC transporter substrate-binding protein [Oscillospiraceae bacterium]
MKKNFVKMLAALALVPTLMFAGCASGSGTENETTTAAENTEAGETADAAEDGSLQKVLDSGKFILGLDATFKPMGYTDEQDNIVGFDIDLAEEVCKRMGVELVKQPVDWDTKEQDLNAGNIDCIWNGLSVNPERAEAMLLSKPYMKNDMIFMVKTDSEIATIADLDGKTIAVQSGSSAQTILAESGMNITAVELGTNVECIQQLELDLVDAVFLDSIVANYEITSTGKAFTVLPDGLSPEEYAVGFRKDDAALCAEVEKILSEMKADGTVGEISTKWFGSDVTTIQ